MVLTGSAVIRSPSGKACGPGVEDDSSDEPVSEFVAQPCRVARVAWGHRCACLDLEAEDALFA